MARTLTSAAQAMAPGATRKIVGVAEIVDELEVDYRRYLKQPSRREQ
jgi:hypothetical protein